MALTNGRARAPTRAMLSCRRGVKSPLAIGDVELADGSVAKGFVGESFGVAGCQDISSCGGWKRYVDAGPKAAAA